MPKDAALPQVGATRPAVTALEAERAAARYGSIHERWSRLHAAGASASRHPGASAVSIRPIVGISNGDTAMPLPIRPRASVPAEAAASVVGVTPRPPSAAGSTDTDERVALAALKPNAHWRWVIGGVLAVVVSVIYFAAGAEPGNEPPNAGSQARPAATRTETLRPTAMAPAPFEPVVEASSELHSPTRAPAAAPLPNTAPGTAALREAKPSPPPQVTGPLTTKDPRPTKLHSSRQKPPPKEGQDGIIGRVPF